MIFDKSRFEIWNQTQHPYKHNLSEFMFFHPAMPGVTNVEGALNYISAVLYPQTKPTVATVGDLPAAGNDINDYRVVLDDGDGKAGSYRWEHREGEVAPSWHKIYDMDWGQDSILAAFQTRTQDLYVFRRGYDDVDETGTIISGILAGQQIYGGKTSGSNLTLSANSGDGTGPNTGFVQVTDSFRPTVNGLLDIGTLSEKFQSAFLSTSLLVGDLTLSNGSIVSSGGWIDFSNNDLTSIGTLVADELIAETNAVINTLLLESGSIVDTTGAIDFADNDLTTAGNITSATALLANITVTTGSIISASGAITFGNNNLSTLGTLDAGDTVVSKLRAGDIEIDIDTITHVAGTGHLYLGLVGPGNVEILAGLVTQNITTVGDVAITGSLGIDNLLLNGNTISSSNTNGNITLNPHGTGAIELTKDLLPSSNNTLSLGSSSLGFKDLFLKGTISNGTNNVALSTILSFRSGVWRDLAQTQPAQAGDSLFFDSVNGVWLASAPDTEVVHNLVSGLTTGDAGHTQFAMLNGRSGGQVINGGTGNGDVLTLAGSTFGPGAIFTKDNFLPFTNASYSVFWSGLNIGSSSSYFNNLYTKGELIGARLQNFTASTLPTSSGQNIGRVVYATDTKKAYVDTGTAFQVLGVGKFSSDISFDGVVLTKDTTVSATIQDARLATWQLLDNANSFEVMYVSIKATSATNVRITTNVALPAGSYRLIGLE